MSALAHQTTRRRSATCKPASAATSASRPLVPGWQSANWSGYAVQKAKHNSYRSISARWIVPAVRPGKKNAYSSAWIGIDGYGNSSLIQTGTGQDRENGKAAYYAWWEILPAAETIIPCRVTAGDVMHARIERLRGNKWLILLRNRTKGWTFRKVLAYTGPASSAEWILEAPSIDGNIARLANYGKIKFGRCRLNRRSPLLKPSDRGVMVQQGRVVSVPSLPNKRQDGFAVTYGSVTPPPPRRTR